MTRAHAGLHESQGSRSARPRLARGWLARSLRGRAPSSTACLSALTDAHTGRSHRQQLWALRAFLEGGWRPRLPRRVRWRPRLGGSTTLSGGAIGLSPRGGCRCGAGPLPCWASSGTAAGRDIAHVAATANLDCGARASHRCAVSTLSPRTAPPGAPRSSGPDRAAAGARASARSGRRPRPPRRTTCASQSSVPPAMQAPPSYEP